MEKVRTIDPFFYEAVNQVFLNPNKQGFVMDGAIGIGKSSNFVMLGAYIVAQSVKPIRKGNKWVRESKWASIRESEQSSVSTILGLIGESIFTPEVMSLDDSPVKQNGSHPTTITISHKMPDNTFLEMRIECHGFNNEKAHNRLRTHEFLGAMVFEMQGIPFDIFEVAMQRCGRYRTEDLVIEREINGEMHRLTGVQETAIVLADINIPARPHPMYEKYYDVNDKSKLPYVFITPPSPLIPVPVDEVSAEIRMSDKYATSIYEGKKVVWLPNPKAYHMTRHFEKRDKDGKNIPWTGYNYWSDKVHLSDSHVRRYIIGKPDNIGGDAAIYKNFKKDEGTVFEKDVEPVYDIVVGYDPGGAGSFEIAQLGEGGHLHVHYEIFFEHSDGIGTRSSIVDFLFPYCEDNFGGKRVRIIPDPASSWLGKSVMMSQSESVMTILREEIDRANERGARCEFIFEPTIIRNQDVDGRINSIQYFLDKDKLSVDPQCDMLITGLVGGYARKKTQSGIISEAIDKDSPYSHPVEALQYVCANLIQEQKRKRGNRGKSKRQVQKIRVRR